MAPIRIADAASSLTLRGRCLVAAGVTLVLLGALLGERALVQLAVFVLALPVISALGVARQTVLHKVQRGELEAVHVNRGRRKGLRINVSSDQVGLFDQP